MTSIIVSLVIPFTFSDEGEYRIRLSGRTSIIKIEHIKNSEGLEKTKGIRIVGAPKIIPDDPSGLHYITKVEISIPLFPDESAGEWVLNERFVSYVCMKYLSRLTEVIRFTTHRYWIRMISVRDIDIFRMETEDETGRKPSLAFRLGFPEGFIFQPIPIYEQTSKKNLIEKILVKGNRLPLSENLLLDSLNYFFQVNFLKR